jgi:hypothetical protein
MTASSSSAEAACLAALQAHLAGGVPDLAGTPEALLDAALRALVKERAAEAAPLVRRLADQAPDKAVRKVARRALYRLAQAGVAVPAPAEPPAPPPSVVRRERERPVRAWLSGIDGSGSRAVWIVFEGGVGGGLRLCSMILNDEVGIMETAGGPITRKRLDTELASLRGAQKLPWVESDAARAAGLVAEALVLHAREGTAPPAEFSRWRALFESAAVPTDAAPTDAAAPALVERSAELSELPELMGWFVDPAAIQQESMSRLEMQDSRLIVSEQIKAEREAAIVDRVIERGFTPDARRRWARRLLEMALIFDATAREDPARLARATAAALADEAQAAERIPLVRTMAVRGLEVAGEVALGRVKLDDVTRAPRRGGERPDAAAS